MLPLRYVALFAFVAAASAQGQGQVAKPTPVPILKQINRHNEDGSYTYGYEGADGSFKIETKLPTGEVKGKYGYVDDTGKVRVVEYGATKYGFEPSGEGITVAPPTLVDETTNKDGTFNQEYADQFELAPAPAPLRPVASIKPRQQLSLQNFPQPQQTYQPAQQTYQPAPQTFQPAPQPQRAVPARAQIAGAAPTNFDYVPQTRPQAARNFAPTPLRPQPQTFSFSSPAPIQEDDDYSEPAPRQLPKITYAQPAARPAAMTTYRFADPAPAQRPVQQFAPAPAPQRPAPQFAPAPRPAPQVSAGRGGILDQLSKDYALPSGGAAPLHDISFGYY